MGHPPHAACLVPDPFPIQNARRHKSGHWLPRSDHRGKIRNLTGVAGSGGCCLIPLDSMFLVPIEPIIPGAPAGVPQVYNDLKGKGILLLPAPFTKNPGEINPSLRRAQYLMYRPAVAQTRSP